MTKDLKINFNTEDGQASFDTETIDEVLEAVIIDSKESVSVLIQSQLGYEILNISSHTGTKYYAPRAVLQGPIRNQIVQDQFDNFILHEPLSIIVRGPKNQDVVIRLRFS